MNFQWKAIYVYYLFGALTVGAFLINRDTFELPMWGTIIGFMFLLWIASDQSWKSYKKSGKACVLVSLKPSHGGHSTIHQDDISLAMSQGTKQPTFMVFATGGFVHEAVAWQGSENFVVCPPEHVEDTGAALICHTKLRKVDYEALPDYVQVELEKLRFFNRPVVRAKQNLWFGMTCKLDSSSTAKNLAEETKFLDQTSVINYLKTLLRDRRYGKDENSGRGKQEQIVVNLPGKD